MKEKFCTLSRVSGMGGYREGGVQVSAKEVAEVCAAFSARGLVAKSVAGDCCAVEHYADVVGICYHPGDGMGGEPSEYV